jgi:hypothetical protein
MGKMSFGGSGSEKKYAFNLAGWSVHEKTSAGGGEEAGGRMIQPLKTLPTNKNFQTPARG